MIQETSLEAYEQVKEHIGRRQLEVYEAIKALGQATDKELAAYLNWQINSTVPRRNELVKLRIVIERGTKKQCGRRTIVWGLS